MEDHHAIHDPANNLATYELRDRDEDQVVKVHRDSPEAQGKRLMRVDRYKVNELEY